MKRLPLVTLLSLTVMSLTSCLVDQKGNEVSMGEASFEVVASKAIVGSKDSRKLMPNDSVDAGTVALIRGPDAVVCTGTSIGLSHVITAAHCVYDDEKKEFKKGITLIPGLHLAGSLKKGSRYFIKRIFIVEDYVKDVNWNGYTTFASSKDIAIIQVREFEGNTYFSDESPKLSLGNPADFNHRGHKLDMIAYHSDDQTKGGSQYYILPCFTQGKRRGVNAVLHDCDTAQGASGAALVGDKKIYAIHTGKAGGNINNTAAIITESILEDINKIIMYEKEGLKNFMIHEPEEPAFNTVSIKNNCDQSVRFSVAFTDLDGDLKATVQDNISANKLKLLNMATKETVAYIHAKSSDGRNNWQGERRFDFGNGLILNFLPVDLKKINGDTTLELNCD